MAAARAASRTMPLLLRSSPRVARMRFTALHRELRPVAIVIPHRLLQTETSSGSNSTSEFPPPGFNAEQAKQSRSKTEEQQSSKSNDAASRKAEVDVSVPRDRPTAAAKTAATEAQSRTELAAQKVKTGETGKEVTAKKDGDEKPKKMTVWQKIKHEAVHYWDGTKLLATEVKISSKLALRMAAGYELTRREHRQLQRTVQDLGRLIPFSVFVIVPFAELLLPVALRLFPNLLPSTYEGKAAKDKKATSLRTTRKETSNFLRQTLRETGLPMTLKTQIGQNKEFTEFFRKIRASGENPSKEDVIKVCKLFKDDLTLDNLSRPQLVGICRYMNLNPIGPDTLLRYQIRHRMRQIKRDDRAIAYEGVDSLSVPELQTACASRGLRTHGMSPGRLRDDLQMWLDLRLKWGVPSTLLVLSNAFMYSQGKETEFDSQIDALQSVLSSIPEELFHEIELEVHTAEGAATNKQRLEVLKEQEELIAEEREQQAETAQSGRQTPSDTENIDEDADDAANNSDPAAVQASEAADAEQQRAFVDEQEAGAERRAASANESKETK